MRAFSPQIDKHLYSGRSLLFPYSEIRAASSHETFGQHRQCLQTKYIYIYIFEVKLCVSKTDNPFFFGNKLILFPWLAVSMGPSKLYSLYRVEES